MNSQIAGLRVAGTIFALVCLAQAVRLFTRAEIDIQGHPVPLWPSAVAIVITGALTLWMWKLSKIKSSKPLLD